MLRGIIFDPTTIPVHVLLLPYPNNNTVPYVQTHANIDTNNTNTDTDTCILMTNGM